MKKLLLLLGVFFACAFTAYGQQTTVTGCITDPNGLVYAGGSFKVNLTPTGGPAPTVNGKGIQGTFGPTALDSNGCFQIALWPNGQISPGGTQWAWQVSSPGANPPVGFGPVSFGPVPITIAGATQDVSATLSSASVAQLRIAASTGLSGTVSNPFVPFASAANTLSDSAFEYDATGAACTEADAGQPCWFIVHTGEGTLSLAADSIAIVNVADDNSQVILNDSSLVIQPVTGGPAVISVELSNGFANIGGGGSVQLAGSAGLSILDPAGDSTFCAGATCTLTPAAAGSAQLVLDGLNGISETGTNGDSVEIGQGAFGDGGNIFARNTLGGEGIASSVSGDTASPPEFSLAGTSSYTDAGGSNQQILGAEITAQISGANVAMDQAIAGFFVASNTGTGTATEVSGGIFQSVCGTATTCTGVHINGASGVTGSAGLLIDAQPAGAATIATSNCTSSGSPAVCGAAPAGLFTVAAAATTEVVNTTAVGTNSDIVITQNTSTSAGTRLAVTCNTTPSTATPVVSAISSGVSFTVTITAPAVNPACFEYHILNF